MEWLKKIWGTILKAWNWLRSDGLLHLLVCALLVVVCAAFVPLWAAVIIAVCIALAKELYDKLWGSGIAEWHDVLCNLIGTALGVLICFLWLFLR